MKTIVKILFHVVAVVAIAFDLAWRLPLNLIASPYYTYLQLVNSFQLHLARLPEKYRHLLPYYDCHGLRHNIDHLNKIDLVKMISQPVEEQARYADKICVDLCKQNFTSIHIGVPGKDFEINATCIGNAAYVMLYHPQMNEREMAYKMLNDIEKILKPNK